MNILLLSPANNDMVSAVSVPMGLLSIGTYLKNAGHNVRILDFAINRFNLKKELELFRPDICGVSVRSPKSVRFAIDISKRIKKYNSGLPVVWGGPFCNNVPLNVLFNESYIDIVSFGEGELTWLELAEYAGGMKKLDEIKGIAFRNGCGIEKTAEREFIDLENILPVDWSLVEVPKYFQYLFGCEKLLYLYYSKGCPAKCTFCYNHDFHRSCYRKKTLELFMSELKELVEKYGLDGFYLSDELSFPDKNELYEFCDALTETGYNLKWGSQTRIGNLKKEDLEYMYKNGCRWMDFGIESGSPEMLKKINKNIPYDLIVPTFDWCSEIGIFSMANFILGFPGETEQDLQMSVNLAKQIKASTVTFGFYCFNYSSPMGRELYKEYKDGMPKKLKDYNKNDFYTNSLPEFSDIPKKDKKVVQSYFMWKQLSTKNITGAPHKFEMFIKHIKIFLKQVNVIGISHLYEAIIKTFIPFVRFCFMNYFCKKTLKKYGLK